MARTLLFSITLLLSAALIFLIEFTCAKSILPQLGGTPAVWNTCLVFFQAGLLLGYAYAHLGPVRLGVRRHALLHLALWLIAFLTLPFHLALNRVGDPPEEPIFWLLWLLTISIGFPFVLLSSTGPLVQKWFAEMSGRHFGPSSHALPEEHFIPTARNPYFLYAASNLGSLLGLVLYPFVVEPNLTLAEQYWIWTWGFVGLLFLLAACAMWGRSQSVSQPSQPAIPNAATIDNFARLRWVLLAAAPSSLMMSVTTYLTTDIAPIPLLWMLPMVLYLGSLVLVFAWHPTARHAFLARWLPGIVLIVMVVPFAEGTEPIWLILAIHLIGFFWIALVCHGELARSKPAADRLTEFYLWLAAGGVLGGLFNALAAPLLFQSILEYPLMLILVAWLTPLDKEILAGIPGHLPRPRHLLDFVAPVLIGLSALGLIRFVGEGAEPGSSQALMQFGMIFGPPALLCLLAAERPLRFSLCLAALLIASGFYPGVHGRPLYRQRSFFGVHRVTEAHGFRVLIHGNTVHGMERINKTHPEPLTYYHRDGPVGRALLKLADAKDPRLERVGIVGLGTGALAYYAEPGQHWRFFEIDPAVAHIAAPETGLFHFLADSRERKANVDVVLGDARLTLERSQERFGVLIIDAFGSDAIPLHLLTREALQIYRDHLREDGILMFHISNRYFHLEPILANLAQENHWACKIRDDRSGDKERGKSASIWLVMAKELPMPVFQGWFPARPNPELRPWTDDFSNLFQILKWRDE